MSRSEPSSPRTGDIIRQISTLRATTDELARLWHTEVSKAAENSKSDGSKSEGKLTREKSHSMSLPPLRSTSRAPKASSLSLDTLAKELSKSTERSATGSLSSSVLSDLSELLMSNKKAGGSGKPKLQRPSSAGCFTSTKYATPACRSKAEGAKLIDYFGVSRADVEFSEKYRKLIRTFGMDFPSHTAVLGMLADQKNMRDVNTYNVTKLYGEETSEEQVRQRKKLESFAGLTEQDYGKFMVQLKLFHKLGEHVPLEELRQGRGRSSSLPPELESLDPDASKLERMLGAKKTQIAGQEKCVKASRIFGEMLPTEYCEELAGLEELDQAPKHDIMKAVRTRKSSQPVTREEMKEARGLAPSPSKKRFFSRGSKSVVSPPKSRLGGGGSPVKPKRGSTTGSKAKASGLSISGTSFGKVAATAMRAKKAVKKK